MSSRAVSGAILMIPTALMLYSIGLSALHDPALHKTNVYVQVPEKSASLGNPLAATPPLDPRATMLARPATLERCRSVMNHQKIEQVCTPLAVRQSRA